MRYDNTIKELIHQFIKDRDSGHFNELAEVDTASRRNREWLRTNILDLPKLTSYSDAEFAHYFFTMYDYMDGAKPSHDRVRCHYFGTTEQCIAIRSTFESIISLILSPDFNHSLLLNELLTNPSYKIHGLGKSTIAQLISAQYPDIPFVNDRTTKFFKDINCPLSSKLDLMQAEINDFFRLVSIDFGDKMTYADINHLFWYTQEITSGQNFMTAHYPGTYNKKSTSSRTPRHKKLTKEQEFEALVAHLQAIHDSAKK